MMTPEKILYETEVTAIGGRDGKAASADGLLSVSLSVPKSLGGPGGEGEARVAGERDRRGRREGAGQHRDGLLRGDRECRAEGRPVLRGGREDGDVRRRVPPRDGRELAHWTIPRTWRPAVLAMM